MRPVAMLALASTTALAWSCASSREQCACDQQDAAPEPDSGECVDSDPPDPDGGVPGWRMTWAAQAGGDVDNIEWSYDMVWDLVPLKDGSVLATGRYAYEGLFGAGEPNVVTLPDVGSEGNSEDTSCFVAQYGGDGSLTWAKGYGGMLWELGGVGVSGETDGSFLHVGAYEQEMVIGYGEPNETTLVADSFEGGGTYNHVLARYSTEGELEWAVRAIDAYGAMFHGIASLPDGSIVVAGAFSLGIAVAPDTPEETILTTPGSTDEDGAVARFAADGTLLWARQISGPGLEFIWSVVRLLGGELLVAGTYQENAVFGAGEENETWLTCGEGETDAGPEDGDGENCPFLAAYDEDGALLWVRDLGYPCPVQDVFPIVQAAPDGGFAISGGFQGTAVLGAGEPNETTLGPTPEDRFDLLVARYESDGSLLWARQSVGGLDESTTMTSYIGYPMAFIDSGELVLAGYYQGIAPVLGQGEPNETTLPDVNRYQILISMFYPNGNLAWSFDQGGSGNDLVATVAAYGDSTFFVGGSFEEAATFGTSSEDQETMTSNGDSEIFVLRFDRMTE